MLPLEILSARVCTGWESSLSPHKSLWTEAVFARYDVSFMIY
jgi:hypothetical protein